MKVVRTLFVLGKETWQGYTHHNVSLQAAAISYYVLFSIVPLMILIGGVLGFVVTDDVRREEMQDKILDALPLSRTEGRDAVESAFDTLENTRGVALAVGLAGTLWTAATVFSAVRRCLNAVWGIYERRPFVTSKLIDFLQLGMLGLLLLASFAITGLVHAVHNFSADWLGFFADSALWEIPTTLVAPMVAFFALTMLYRLVPAAHPRWRDAAAAAAPAALALFILANGFAFFVANFNNFDAIYGALAGVMLFLLFMNIAANILLIGAELSRTFNRFFAGEFEALINPVGPQGSVMQQTIRAVKGLFVKQP
jgi:membrane protein